MDEKKTEKIDPVKDSEYIEIPFGNIRNNPWIIASFVLLIALVVVLFVNWKGTGITGNVVAIDGNEAGANVINFLNSNPNLDEKISLVSVAKDQSGQFYEAIVSYKGSDVPVYVTLDGKYLLNGAPISLDQKFPTATGNTANAQNTQQEIPKTDKPKVELYVMSFCPYGNKAEDTMLPVYNLLKDKVDWNVHYIVSGTGDSIQSLHGANEVLQNKRELCVLKNYGIDKLWKFMTYINDKCGSDGSCWETAATTNAIDKAKINTCITNDATALLEAESANSDAAGVSGSPTMFINGVESSIIYQYGNSEAYKQAICDAFTTAPAECSQVLTGSSTTTGAATAGGSC